MMYGTTTYQKIKQREDDYIVSHYGIVSPMRMSQVLNRKYNYILKRIRELKSEGRIRDDR